MGAEYDVVKTNFSVQLPLNRVVSHVLLSRHDQIFWGRSPSDTPLYGDLDPYAGVDVGHRGYGNRVSRSFRGGSQQGVLWQDLITEKATPIGITKRRRSAEALRRAGFGSLLATSMTVACS